MKENKIETFCPASRKEWRQWLKKNHSSKQSIWLVCYKKESNMPVISWRETVDEPFALAGLTAQENLLTMKNSCNFSANANRIVPGQKLTRRR
jgi:hypothetical protein